MNPLPKASPTSSARKAAQLSPTELKLGMQCQKSLYLQVHHPTLASGAGSADGFRVTQGQLVRDAVRRLFPGGTQIEAEDLTGAIESTADAIRDGSRLIYGAVLEHAGVYARIQMLRLSDEGWEIIDVKPAASIHPGHIQDIALQAWVLLGLSMPIARCLIVHINRNCAHPDLDKLFVTVDVTPYLSHALADIDAQIASHQSMLRADEVPDIDIGPHCSSPFECAFQDHCFCERGVPTPSVFDLPGIGQKAWTSYQNGLVQIGDLDEKSLSPVQRHAQEVHRTGTRYVDVKLIEKELKRWRFPLAFLDFETANPAIPRYPGTAPYQMIPFQFSSHVLRGLGTTPSGTAYLHTDLSDPRPALIERLCVALKGDGSVVAYNMSFERTCLKELAAFSPEHREQLDSIANRLVDPLPTIRKAVYDAGFAGSFSIKRVAPALLGPEYDYSTLLVNDGSVAQLAFEELIRLPNGSNRKQEIIRGLEEYCERDTLALVRLVEWLWAQINPLPLFGAT